jgi:uncharacterized protein DUF4255
MAGFKAISAVGLSLVRLLNSCFEADRNLFEGGKPTAVLVRTNDFDPNVASPILNPPALSIFPYRVEANRTMRAAWSGVSSLDGHVHLPLDMHFLITPWDANCEYELDILGRAMECLESTPILTGPLLHPSGNWAPMEAIQVVLDDVPADSIFRTFDSLAAHFRLSVPYLARVLRLNGRATNLAPEVTTVVTGKVPAALGP